jgi:hypothetical protein
LAIARSAVNQWAGRSRISRRIIGMAGSPISMIF